MGSADELEEGAHLVVQVKQDIFLEKNGQSDIS
jgi:hypothetical protein